MARLNVLEFKSPTLFDQAGSLMETTSVIDLVTSSEASQESFETQEVTEIVPYFEEGSGVLPQNITDELFANGDTNEASGFGIVEESGSGFSQEILFDDQGSGSGFSQEFDDQGSGSGSGLSEDLTSLVQEILHDEQSGSGEFGFETVVDGTANFNLTQPVSNLVNETLQTPPNLENEILEVKSLKIKKNVFTLTTSDFKISVFRLEQFWFHLDDSVRSFGCGCYKFDLGDRSSQAC